MVKHNEALPPPAGAVAWHELQEENRGLRLKISTLEDEVKELKERFEVKKANGSSAVAQKDEIDHAALEVSPTCNINIPTLVVLLPLFF